MGYSHYLENRVTTDSSRIFTDEQWNEFVPKAAALINSWFSKLSPAVKLDLDYTTEGMFRDDTSASILSTAELIELFKATGSFRVTLKEDGETLWLSKHELNSFVSCKTNYTEGYDALVVALYALTSEVTNHRVRFTSDGEADDLEAGLGLLATVGVDFDFDKQVYSDFIDDPDEFMAVLEKALKNLNDDDRIIALCNMINPDSNLFYDEDMLNEMFADRPMDLVRALRDTELSDYYYSDVGGFVSMNTKEAATKAKEMILEFPTTTLMQEQALIEICDTCLNGESGE